MRLRIYRCRAGVRAALALRVHPSIVAHERLCTRIVERIDIQQLPSPGSDSRRCGSAVTILAITGQYVYKSRLANLVASAREPLRVRVQGRPGVGCRTVVRVLRGAGVPIAESGGDPELGVPDLGVPELGVYVINEAFKPEDHAALSRLRRPGLVVLNKADLIGSPAGAAVSRHRELRTQVRVPVEPLTGLVALVGLGVAVLDESEWAALEVLVSEPADLGSVDGFVARPHFLARPIRERLLADLDLLGISCAVATLRRGGDRYSVVDALREASGVDAVLAALDRLSAPVRYQRLMAGLRPAEPEWVASDEVVLARMAAAIEVLAAAGMAPEKFENAAGDDATDYIRRAVLWERNVRGFLSPLYRACGSDVARGSLRLANDAAPR